MGKEFLSIELFRESQRNLDIARKFQVNEDGILLMQYFILGVRYYEENELKTVGDERMVGISLVDLDEATTAWNGGGVPRHIIIGRQFLNHLSTFSRSDMLNIERVDNELVFCGYLSDLMFLAGVEEAHHAYNDNGQIEGHDVEPLSVSLAEYDALEAEYNALLCCRNSATKLKMPKKTVDQLNTRIQEAELIRAKTI